MQNAISVIGNLAAVLGILVCLVAGAARASGSFYVLNYEAMTLFFVGVGMMVFAVLAKVEMLLRR